MYVRTIKSCSFSSLPASFVSKSSRADIKPNPNAPARKSRCNFKMPRKTPGGFIIHTFSLKDRIIFSYQKERICSLASLKAELMDCFSSGRSTRLFRLGVGALASFTSTSLGSVSNIILCELKIKGNPLYLVPPIDDLVKAEGDQFKVLQKGHLIHLRPTT